MFYQGLGLKKRYEYICVDISQEVYLRLIHAPYIAINGYHKVPFLLKQNWWTVPRSPGWVLNLILTELAWKHRHREIVLFSVQCFPFRIPAEGLEDSEIRRRSKSAQFSPTLTLSLSLISYSTQHFLFGFVACREVMMGEGNGVASVIMLTFTKMPGPHADTAWAVVG